MGSMMRGKVPILEIGEQLSSTSLRAGEGTRELRWSHRTETKKQHPSLEQSGIHPQTRKRLATRPRGARHPRNLAERLQLGGASCRKRVCQYVQNSVVSVS